MPVPAGLIVLAASAALKYANDQDALRRQGKLAEAMRAYQKQKSAESLVATEALLSKQTPEARSGELADVTREREQSLRDTVGAAQAFDAPIAGKVSGDYRAAQEREANTVAERTRRAIAQLAAMGAPGEQALKQKLRYAKAAGVVDAANVASDNVGRAYRTSISGTRPDPFADLLAQTGMAAGSGMLGSGAGAAVGSSEGMGADSTGNFAYEDSTGNPQRSSIPYQRRQRMNNAFTLWGAR